MTPWKSVIVLLLVCVSYCAYFLGDEAIDRLTEEDGIVESIGAFFFMLPRWSALPRSSGTASNTRAWD